MKLTQTIIVAGKEEALDLARKAALVLAAGETRVELPIGDNDVFVQPLRKYNEYMNQIGPDGAAKAKSGVCIGAGTLGSYHLYFENQPPEGVRAAQLNIAVVSVSHQKYPAAPAGAMFMYYKTRVAGVPDEKTFILDGEGNEITAADLGAEALLTTAEANERKVVPLQKGATTASPF